jgi:hippurate hydrolase
VKSQFLSLASLLLFATLGQAQSDTGVTGEVTAVYPQSDALYLDIHRHPELSFHEQRTATKLASGLRELGYEVSTGIGRTGVVGVLRNGSGPVVVLRTELDALPVEEKTGLPYASTVRSKNDSGAEVGVAHACGHDIHMAAWMATARIMVNARSRWRGTLVMVGQPAEELGEGASVLNSPRPSSVAASLPEPLPP